MLTLTVHFLTCVFMAGLIWTIQILHYPTFSFVDKDRFLEFHKMHSRNITFIVGPVMVLELITAVMLIAYSPGIPIFWANMSLLVLTWGITFFVSVPLHTKLTESQDLKAIERLVCTNWYRTWLWSLRTLIICYQGYNFGNFGK